MSGIDTLEDHLIIYLVKISTKKTLKCKIQAHRCVLYIRSLDLFYTVTNYIKWVKTSWTCSKINNSLSITGSEVRVGHSSAFRAVK